MDSLPFLVSWTMRVSCGSAIVCFFSGNTTQECLIVQAAKQTSPEGVLVGEQHGRHCTPPLAGNLEIDIAVVLNLRTASHFLQQGPVSNALQMSGQRAALAAQVGRVFIQVHALLLAPVLK